MGRQNSCCSVFWRASPNLHYLASSKFGGPNWDRTSHPRVISTVLYQLSYGPMGDALVLRPPCFEEPVTVYRYPFKKKKGHRARKVLLRLLEHRVDPDRRVSPKRNSSALRSMALKIFNLSSQAAQIFWTFVPRSP